MRPSKKAGPTIYSVRKVSIEGSFVGLSAMTWSSSLNDVNDERVPEADTHEIDDVAAAENEEDLHRLVIKRDITP